MFCQRMNFGYDHRVKPTLDLKLCASTSLGVPALYHNTPSVGAGPPQAVQT